MSYAHRTLLDFFKIFGKGFLTGEPIKAFGHFPCVYRPRHIDLPVCDVKERKPRSLPSSPGKSPGRHDMTNENGMKKSSGRRTPDRSIEYHPRMMELRARHTRELNEYLARNRFYAYNDPEKFVEGMRMLGLEPGDTDKIVDVGGGAMRRDSIPELRALIERQKKEAREMKKALSEKNAVEGRGCRWGTGSASGSPTGRSSHRRSTDTGAASEG